MNCYNHNEIPAVGICKHCNKGICPDCLSDTGDGLACKGHCLEEVNMINKLINHNKKVVKGTPGNWTSSGILYLVMGSIFILTTVFYLRKIDLFLSAMGLLFMAYGIYVLNKGRAYKENPRDF